MKKKKEKKIEREKVKKEFVKRIWKYFENNTNWDLMTYACIVIAFTHTKEEKNRVKKEELKSKVIKKRNKTTKWSRKRRVYKDVPKKDEKIEKKSHWRTTPIRSLVKSLQRQLNK